MNSSPFEARFNRLFNEGYGALFTYLFRLSGDNDLASDLAQDAFLQLYLRGTFPDNVPAWLVTVAHNRLRDHQRSVRRRLSLLITRSRDVPRADPGRQADQELEVDDERRQVRQVLARLTERERQILLLHHSGYSYREVALVLCVAPTGVGTLLRRAGAAFRRAFEETIGAPD